MLDSLEVIVVGKVKDFNCQPCVNGRTLKDITESLHKQLHRQYRGKVVVHFVDVDGTDFLTTPWASAVIENEMPLPLVFIGGVLRYSGLFAPSMINRDVARTMAPPDDGRFVEWHTGPLSAAHLSGGGKLPHTNTSSSSGSSFSSFSV